MNETPDIDESSFETSLEHQMRIAVATVDPDIEQALRAVKGGASRQSNDRGSQWLLVVAAAIVLCAGGIFAASRFSSDSDEIQVGDSTTTSVPDPDTTVTVIEEAWDFEQLEEAAPLLAREIPRLTDSWADGDAVRVDWLLLSEGLGNEPFRFTEIWADDGRAFALSEDGTAYELLENDTLAARRDTLGMAGSAAEWQAAILSVGGFLDLASASEADQLDRLWDDVSDLLASGTLDSDQRAFLFDGIEMQLGVTYRYVPASLGTDLIAVVWEGHSDGAIRVFLSDSANGKPVDYSIGESGRPSIAYEASRVTLDDELEAGPWLVNEVADVGISVDANGFSFTNTDVGVTGAFPFGSPSESAILAVSDAFGPPDSGAVSTQCLTDSVGWGSFSLSIDSASDTIVGWTVRRSRSEGPVVATAEGLGIGSTVAEVRAIDPGLIIEEITFGWDSIDGPISWLTSGPTDTDTVQAMWAGETCVFR